MKPFQYFFLLLIGVFLSANPLLAQQKVGLVLSGGGATGFAHIGVLQALEEKGIPIDYITGTSAGALIGGMYAVGYSPEEMKAIVLRDEFLLMSKGQLKRSQEFLAKETEDNASIFSFRFTSDSLFQKSLPTHLANSTFLDFELFKILGIPGANHDNNFDQLFIPFRCIASDIVAKQNVVFKSGPLNEAVRASMTYPFYFPALRVNGRMLYDGGLYNNFPADVIYDEFAPDYIIGSNVSYNAEEPKEKDLISQITNMLVAYSDFSLPCEEGMIIQPKLDISTFDFESVSDAIEIGYQTGLKFADSILLQIKQTVSKESLDAKRKEFRSKSYDHPITNIVINAPKSSKYFVRKTLLGKKSNTTLELNTLEKRYYKLAATEHIDFLFPILRMTDTNQYELGLNVRKKNEWKLNVGGHISSRPINEGYVGLTYLRLRKTATQIHGSTYFGKFYGSSQADIKIELPFLFPITIEPYYVRNRWDYFKSFATFFEEVKPSFLVQNENYTGLKIYHPFGNNSMFVYDAHYFKNEDDYYQTLSFTPSDTTDITLFEGFSGYFQIEQNSLNRKQFANSGHHFNIQARYVNGRELTTTGSTVPVNQTVRNLHSWINLNFEGQSFIINQPMFHLGLQGKATFNSQSLFSNYTSSLLQLTSFDVLPDMQTFFLSEYRSPLFFGGGTNVVFTLRKSLDLRFDGFYYQPLTTLTQRDDGTFGYSKPFKGETFLASTSLIYYSFFGPIRFTANYFPKQKNPISLQFSYGFIIFNDRSTR